MEANLKSILCVSLLILLTPSAYAELPGDSADGKRLHGVLLGCEPPHRLGEHGQFDADDEHVGFGGKADILDPLSNVR